MASDYRAPMAYVGITDWEWFSQLRKLEGIDEVNFWQPVHTRSEPSYRASRFYSSCIALGDASLASASLPVT